MSDIAVKCRECGSVSHWLKTIRMVWSCPNCRGKVHDRVYDGRKVNSEKDHYTLWEAKCHHTSRLCPWPPAEDYCTRCQTDIEWVISRHLDDIVPLEKTKKDIEHAALLTVINGCLDRIVEKK